MANLCPDCLANLDVVGRMHRCIPRKAPAYTGVAEAYDGPPPNPDAQNCGAYSKEGPAQTYLYRNPEARKAYMRDYMRKRRAEKRANG